MIPASARSAIQLFGAWCGTFYVVLLILGWGVIAHFIPPHHPSAGAQEIAAIYQAEFLRIRIGMIVVMFAALIVIPFSAVVSEFLAKVEGGAGVLAYSALLGGAGTAILTFYPAIWWLVAAYRTERAADLIYLMNDMAWLQDIGGVTLFFALPACVAVAAFCDTSDRPVFPRWFGYFNIWVVLLVLPDQLLFFVHSGPFAWNGAFGLWLPLVVFGAWFFTTTYFLRRAILQERVSEGRAINRACDMTGK